MADTERTAVTNVTINGKTFDLKQMPTQRGLELYAQLPENYRAQADQIAQVLTTFASIQKVAGKDGLDPTELARDWVRTASNSEAAKAVRQGLSEAKQRALKELDAQRGSIDFDALVKMVPGGETALAAAHVTSGAGKVVGAAAAASAAAVDGAFNGPARLWNMVATLGTEGWGKMFGYGDGAPSDKAKAFAAATMALRYQAVEARHAMPLIDFSLHSQATENPVEYGKAGFSWLTDWVRQNVPLVEYVVAAYRWVVNAGWKEGNPGYLATVEQVKQDFAQEAKKTPANGEHYARLADREMWDKEGAEVKRSLDAAIHVAGLKSGAGASTVATASQVTARGTDGVDRTYDRGQVTGEVTPGQRIQGAAHELTGTGNPVVQTIAVGAAAASTATVANNAAKGFVRSVTAHVADAAPATEKLMAWANKPVQFGVGEMAVHGWKGKLLNLPGTLANVGGRLTGWGATKVVAIGQNPLVKLVAKAWGGAVSPALEAGKLVQGKIEGNEGKVENASNALTVIAGDAAIGAAAGAVILGPIGAAGGALTGAAVGGVVTLFGDLFDSKKLRGYDRVSEEMGATRQEQRQPDPGLQAAAVEATQRAEAARVAAAASQGGNAMERLRMALANGNAQARQNAPAATPIVMARADVAMGASHPAQTTPMGSGGSRAGMAATPAG